VLPKKPSQLESASIDDIESHITDFAINNQSSVSIYNSENTELAYVNFSSDESPSDNEVVSGTINFQNAGKTYSLVAKIPSSSVDQLSGTFTHVFCQKLLLAGITRGYRSTKPVNGRKAALF